MSEHWDEYDEPQDDAEEQGAYAKLSCDSIHFNTDSAVLPPVAVKVFAQVLAYAAEHPDERLLILSHTDSVASTAYNETLSQLRALNVLNLLSGREASWVTTSAGRHRTRCVQQFLQWVDAGPNWNCHPGSLVDRSVRVLDEKTKQALVRFERDYAVNVLCEEREPLEDADVEAQARRIGDRVEKSFWNTVYRLYRERLADLVDVAPEQLGERTASLVFVDPDEPSRGCGEHYPLEGKGQDEFESELNRRTEFLFFPPDVLVPAEDLSNLYDSERYTVTKIPCPDDDSSITITPPPGNFAIVLDVSGSMKGLDGVGQTRLARAQAAVVELLEAKKYSGDTFSLHTFSDEHTDWRGGAMQPCEAADIDAAKTWILGRTHGGFTDTRNALARFNLRDHPELTVIFVSDGLPSTPTGGGNWRQATPGERTALQTDINAWRTDDARGFKLHTYGFVLTGVDAMSAFMKGITTPPLDLNWHPIRTIPPSE